MTDKSDVDKFKDELQELMKKYPNVRLQTGHTIEVVDMRTMPTPFKPIFKD